MRCVNAISILVMVMCASAGANLITNPGYENGLDGSGNPTGWEFVGNPGTQLSDGWDLTLPQGTGNSSANCVRMDNNTSTPDRPGFRQILAETYEEGVTYEFGVDWHIPSGQSPRTTQGLEFGYLDDTGSVVTLTASNFVVEYSVGGGDMPWQTQAADYTPAAESAEIGRPIAVTWRNRASRDLEIDNAYLVPEPAAMILLGLGGLTALRRRRNV